MNKLYYTVVLFLSSPLVVQQFAAPKNIHAPQIIERSLAPCPAIDAADERQVGDL